MKRFFFIAVLIMSLVFVALLAWSIRPSQYQQKPSETYQSYQTTERLAQLPPKEKAANKTTEKYTQKEIEDWAASRSDLAAQWNMADTAFIGLCVGMLGLIFIAWTLVETRGAAKSAAETLSIAQDTLNETRRSTRRQLRAYMSCEDPIFTIYNPSQQEGFIDFELTFEFRNNGQTPAYEVTASCVAHFSSKLFHINDKPITANLGKWVQISSKGQRKKTIPISIDGASILSRQTIEVESFLEIVVVVEYYDIMSITDRIHKDRFSDAFMFRAELTASEGIFEPVFIEEKNKKTV